MSSRNANIVSRIDSGVNPPVKMTLLPLFITALVEHRNCQGLLFFAPARAAIDRRSSSETACKSVDREDPPPPRVLWKRNNNFLELRRSAAETTAGSYSPSPSFLTPRALFSLLAWLDFPSASPGPVLIFHSRRRVVRARLGKLSAMTDETKLFRYGNLVRLRGKNNSLARVNMMVDTATKKNHIELLDDGARPPVPATPARMLWIEPRCLNHVCEYCLVAAAMLMRCGKCKTAHYCNAECQRADWARHKVKDCRDFRLQPGLNKPQPVMCFGVELGLQGDVVEDVTTTLCSAARSGQLSVVRYLVEQGANVDEADKAGMTPLYGAAEKGHVPVLQYLAEQGADKDKATKSSATPLFVAVTYGNLAAVQCLVELGADVDKYVDEMGTPLSVAAVLGHLAVVQCLVEHGADTEKTNSKGATPLLMAAQGVP